MLAVPSGEPSSIIRIWNTFSRAKTARMMFSMFSRSNGRLYEPLLQPQHKKALILGTGGASKAVYRGLANLGIESVFVSRTKKESSYLTYDELTPEIMQEYTIIVNCTPVGMYPKVDFCPDIPYDQLTPNHLLYDLLYNPNETLFMKKGEAHGAVTKNGLEMLLLQAFAAWEIWNK